MDQQLFEILEGFLFALLWASATVATKFAVRSVDPFLLTCLRFLTVGIILQGYQFLANKYQYKLPSGKQMMQLFVLGLLNITVYMTGFLIAIKTVSAGLISLVMATNPLILILLSALILKRKLSTAEWIGIFISLGGLVIASIPNLKDNHATIIGLVALVLGIVSLSVGSIYFSKSNLALSRMEVNTWQITIGGLLFIPIVLCNAPHNFIKTDLNFYLSFAWLAIPVSIVAYLMWLKLLHKDAVKAGIWLFLSPVLGYAMAVIILKEHVTAYGIIGALLVVSGLFYSRRKPAGS